MLSSSDPVKTEMKAENPSTILMAGDAAKYDEKCVNPDEKIGTLIYQLRAAGRETEKHPQLALLSSLSEVQQDERNKMLEDLVAYLNATYPIQVDDKDLYVHTITSQFRLNRKVNWYVSDYIFGNGKEAKLIALDVSAGGYSQFYGDEQDRFIDSKKAHDSIVPVITKLQQAGFDFSVERHSRSTFFILMNETFVLQLAQVEANALFTVLHPEHLTKDTSGVCACFAGFFRPRHDGSTAQPVVPSRRPSFTG